MVDLNFQSYDFNAISVLIFWSDSHDTFSHISSSKCININEQICEPQIDMKEKL